MRHLRTISSTPAPRQAVSQLDILLDGIITILNTLSVGFVSFLGLTEFRQSNAAFKIDAGDTTGDTGGTGGGGATT